MNNLNLFELEPNANLLPYDGIVNNYGIIFERKTAEIYYQKLLHNIEWRNDVAIIFRKK
ncbi:hypothetical protein [Rodentibacter heidelbergensis]|uniref:hypothetical protein n=1 Tax=Rodentibacter heidelbergensis TaxID=1908258 RepID=UPI0013016795|nr:hypothetical protein [Rodentibacter heidelbergensis]